jgi:hypothetical protein
MRDNSSNHNNYKFSEERLIRRKKRIIKLFAISIIIIFFIGIFGSVVYNAGYVPIKRLLIVKKPIGESDEIDIDEHINKYPEIKKFPYIDKLKYKVYGTNKSLKNVANDYKIKLGEEGYNILYEGVAYKDEIALHYYGFLKGITGVGIVITSEESVALNYETMVLYTTGNAFDYRNILNWYKENSDIIGDIDL